MEEDPILTSLKILIIGMVGLSYNVSYPPSSHGRAFSKLGSVDHLCLTDCFPPFRRSAFFKTENRRI
jgi:hypothetical protein